LAKLKSGFHRVERRFLKKRLVLQWHLTIQPTNLPVIHPFQHRWCNLSQASAPEQRNFPGRFINCILSVPVVSY